MMGFGGIHVAAVCFFPCLVLGLVSPAAAHAQSEYPVCDVPLAVGEVPDSPFQAELVVDSWTIAPDGSRKPVSSPDAPPGIVARDSKGRVMVKSQTKITYSNSEAKGESPGWQETICDPVAGTVTSVSYSDVFHQGVEPSTGETALFPAGIGGTALVRPQVNVHTTVVFSWWHRIVNGRENLGPETFEGMSAYRFRLHPIQKERSVHDVVNSDELFVQLAQTTWGDDPGSENEKKITHIRRVEPPPTLFDIPEGVHIQIVHGKDQQPTAARSAD